MAWKLDISLVKPDTKAFIDELDRMEKRLRKIDSTVKTVDQSIVGHNVKVNSASKAYKGLAVPIASGSVALDKLRASVAKTNTSLEKTKSVTKSINQSVVGMVSKISLAKQAYALLAGVVRSLTEDSIKLESAVVAVGRIAGLTAKKDLAALTANFRTLSLDIPIAASEIARFSETAARFGVRGADNLSNFAETFAKFSVITGETSDATVRSFARIAKLTRFDTKHIDRLANAIVVLGNNNETTEGKIVSFAERLAGDTAAFNVATESVLAFATTFDTIGVRTELGGTLVSKSLAKITEAAIRGGTDLDKLADAAGITSQEFVELANTAPIEVFQKLVNSGESSRRILELLGDSNIRMAKSFGNLKQNAATFNETLKQANSSLKSSVELNKQAAAQADTTANRIKKLDNSWEDLKANIGGSKFLGEVVDNLSGLTEITRFATEELGGLGKALGFIAKLNPFSVIKGSLEFFGFKGSLADLAKIAKEKRIQEAEQKKQDAIAAERKDNLLKIEKGITKEKKDQGLLEATRTKLREGAEAKLDKIRKGGSNIESILVDKVNEARLAGLSAVDKKREKLLQKSKEEVELAREKANIELKALKLIEQTGGANNRAEQAGVVDAFRKVQKLENDSLTKNIAKLNLDESTRLEKIADRAAALEKARIRSIERNENKLENNNKRLENLKKSLDNLGPKQNTAIQSITDAEAFIAESAEAQFARDEAIEAAKDNASRIVKSNKLIADKIDALKTAIEKAKPKVKARI